MTFSSVGHGGEEGRGSFLLLADAGEKGSAWAGWRGQGVTLGVMDGGLSPRSGRGQLAPESREEGRGIGCAWEVLFSLMNFRGV